MESILEFLESISPGMVYVGLFLGAYLENLFPPMPGDTVVVFGAYLVGIGKLRLYMAFISTTAGSILGFMTYFYLGRVVGKKVMQSGNFRFISFEQYKRAEAWLERYGYRIIAVNRFLAGARTILSFVAGIAQLNTVKVFLLALLSCAIWNWILIFAGYKLGENWEVVINYVKDYNIVVFSVILIFALFYFGFKFFQRKKKQQ